jgi:hypothetical protein
MKIALLLTGQLRTVDMVKYLHMNTIIKKHDTDVFIAIDLNNTLQTANLNPTHDSTYEKAIDVIKYFNPKKYFISNNFNTEYNRLLLANTSFIKWYKSIFAQYYIVHNAYKLLQDHIDKTNTEYDLVIRLRFDQFLCGGGCNSLFRMLEKQSNGAILYNAINTDIFRDNTIQYQLPLYKPMKNEIYIFGRGAHANYEWVNDQFFYHTQESVATLLTFYNSLPHLIDIAVNKEGNKGHCIFEHVFAIFLKNKQFNIKSSDLANQFIREFT